MLYINFLFLIVIETHIEFNTPPTQTRVTTYPKAQQILPYYFPNIQGNGVFG